VTAVPVWTVCPVCKQRSGIRVSMDISSKEEYFECDACGHVWKGVVTDDTPKR
jgi:hypothetical protein